MTIMSEKEIKSEKPVEELSSKATWKSREEKVKFTYKEQKEYETIDADIAALEEKIEKLESEMTAVSTDFVKLNQIMVEKEAAESLLEEKLDRWMYLEELAARIAEQ